MSRQKDFGFEEDNKESFNEPDKDALKLPSKVGPTSSAHGGSRAPSEYGSKKQDKLLSEPSDVSCFYVGIEASILYGEFPFLNGVRCKFFIKAGKDWKLLNVSHLIIFIGH